MIQTVTRPRGYIGTRPTNASQNVAGISNDLKAWLKLYEIIEKPYEIIDKLYETIREFRERDEPYEIIDKP